jgi:hypothetical protein
MASRPHSSSKAALTVEYDLDLINKQLSNLFGSIESKKDSKGKFHLILEFKPGLIETLYEAGLADEGSHKELVDSHSFTKTIDGYKFKYSIEPYGSRHGYLKMNSLIIIFYPATHNKKFIGYKDGETDELFSNIVKVVENFTDVRSTNKPANVPAKCFDPIMANNVNIDNTHTVFYIMDKTNKIISTACLDKDSLETYLTSKDYVFFRCKPAVPISAFSITKDSVFVKNPIRVLNLNFKTYIYDNQAQKIKAGKEYIIKPTTTKLGRIASYNIAIDGGEIVSGNHCGPETDDYIYEILEVKKAEGGKRKRKTRTIKKIKRKSKTHKRNK